MHLWEFHNFNSFLHFLQIGQNLLWLVLNASFCICSNPMQHSYQRYTYDSTLGLITSPNANVLFSHDGTLAISGALEELYVWNIKLGSKVEVVRKSEF